MSKNESIVKTFGNVLLVLEYLKKEGWKIAKSSIYSHVKEGKLRPRSDGKYHQQDILKYARSWLKRLDGSTEESSITELSRKQKADADVAEYDARIKRIKAEAIEGKYVLREYMTEELAVQASAFRNALQTFIHSQAEEIVSFISGDVSRIPDLIEFLMVRSDEHFFRYAEDWQARGPLITIENVAKGELRDDSLDDTEDVDEEETGELHDV